MFCKRKWDYPLFQLNSSCFNMPSVSCTRVYYTNRCCLCCRNFLSWQLKLDKCYTMSRYYRKSTVQILWVSLFRMSWIWVVCCLLYLIAHIKPFRDFSDYLDLFLVCEFVLHPVMHMLVSTSISKALWAAVWRLGNISCRVVDRWLIGSNVIGVIEVDEPSEEDMVHWCDMKKTFAHCSQV